MASSGRSYSVVRAGDIGSLLNVKPDSNWSRPRGTTVFAGVKVGRSVLIGPSGSSSCDRVAHNRSSTLRSVAPGFFWGSVGAASSVAWEGELGCDTPAFGVSSGTRDPGSWAPAETPAAKIKSQANRATSTRAIPYHPLLGQIDLERSLGWARPNVTVQYLLQSTIPRPDMRRSTRLAEGIDRTMSFGESGRG